MPFWSTSAFRSLSREHREPFFEAPSFSWAFSWAHCAHSHYKGLQHASTSSQSIPHPQHRSFFFHFPSSCLPAARSAATAHPARRDLPVDLGAAPSFDRGARRCTWCRTPKRASKTPKGFRVVFLDATAAQVQLPISEGCLHLPEPSGALFQTASSVDRFRLKVETRSTEPAPFWATFHGLMPC